MSICTRHIFADFGNAPLCSFPFWLMWGGSMGYLARGLPPPPGAKQVLLLVLARAIEPLPKSRVDFVCQMMCNIDITSIGTADDGTEARCKFLPKLRDTRQDQGSAGVGRSILTNVPQIGQEWCTQ